MQYNPQKLTSQSSARDINFQENSATSGLQRSSKARILHTVSLQTHQWRQQQQVLSLSPKNFKSVAQHTPPNTSLEKINTIKRHINKLAN